MYTHDFFSHHIPVWLHLLTEFKNQPNLNFLEIGCFEGMATSWLLTHILTHQTSRITVIDTFEGSPEFEQLNYNSNNIKRIFLENIETFKDKVIIRQGKSEDILPTLSPIFDFIYVDGSHAYKDARNDMFEGWKLLKPKGIMIIDDYSWEQVKAATYAFLTDHQDFVKFSLPNAGVQLALRKTVV